MGYRTKSSLTVSYPDSKQSLLGTDSSTALI